MKAWKVEPYEISKAMELIYKYLLLDKKDFSLEEFYKLTIYAIKWKLEQAQFPLYLEYTKKSHQNVIPQPFKIKGNVLYKTVIKNSGDFEE